MQTKLGHAVLARDEAQDSARHAAIATQIAEAALAAERDAREKAEEAQRQACADRDAAEERLRRIIPMGRPAQGAATPSELPPVFLDSDLSDRRQS